MEIIITNNDLTCLLSCWNKARIFVKLPLTHYYCRCLVPLSLKPEAL